MSKRRVGVVGGRGYTGRELLRLLSSHPDLDVAYARGWSVGLDLSLLLRTIRPVFGRNGAA